jgi:hypothetical protein
LERALAVIAIVLAAMACTVPAALADVTIDDVQQEEGEDMVFTVTADSADGFVEYSTASGTATEGSDFEATSGFLFFAAPGSEQVVVPTIADEDEEADETFSVLLDFGSSEFRGEGSGNDFEGIGTIIDGGGSGGGGGSGLPPPGTQPPPPGGVPDSDGDGVANDVDACPLVAGSEPNGCPAAGMLPAPEFGRTVNLSVLDDDVFVKLPAGFTSAADAGAGAAQRPAGFVALVDPRQVPVGTLVDTENGRVRLVSARGLSGGTQSGNFAGGLFQVGQRRRAGARTVLRLRGGNFRRRCRTAGGARAAAAGAQRRRVSARTLRRLTGNAKGRFRTRGRHSSATIRGTVWTVSDRCDGTLTRVRRGRVRVRDFRRARNIVLRAGRSYLARP